MAFGNKFGFTICDKCVSKEELFAPAFGNIIVEVKAENVKK